MNEYKFGYKYKIWHTVGDNQMETIVKNENVRLKHKATKLIKM